MNFRLCVLAVVASITCALAGSAQGRMDVSLKSGDGWSLPEGTGNRLQHGRSAILAINGTGDDMSAWRRLPAGLRAETAYRIRFRARITPGSTASTIISGLEPCNRDFEGSPNWQPYSFVFTTPQEVQSAFLRMGQWHLKGTVQFADISLIPVIPIYRALSGVGMLGDGEQISGDAYKFVAPLSSDGSNSARALLHHSAYFNSNRWVFGPGAEVVYRHNVAGTLMHRAKITITQPYHTEGDCLVQFSADCTTWSAPARITGIEPQTISAPDSLRDAREVFVKISSAAKPGPGGVRPGSFQVDGYTFEASLSKRFGTEVGNTAFAEVIVADPSFHVDLKSAASSAAAIALTATLSGAGNKALQLKLTEGTPENTTPTVVIRTTATPVQGSARMSASLVHRNTGPIWNELSITRTGERSPAYVVRLAGTVPELYATNYGKLLGSASFANIWWCGAGRKVSEDRPPPPPLRPRAAPIEISGAGRERVSFQLVLRGTGTARTVRAAVGRFIAENGDALPVKSIQLREAVRVQVQVPTDAVGASGNWPDPLVPLPSDGSIQLLSGRNTCIWITLTLPAGQKPGLRRGEITLNASKSSIHIPIALTVRGFDLPPQTALRSGFGISAGNLRSFHGLTSETDLEREWALYMNDFEQHRMAPYDPMALHPYKVSLTNSNIDHVKIDFTDFDAAAATYLSKFNSFTIAIQGLGGGRYPNFERGQFMGYKPESLEYDRLMTEYGKLLQAHLEKMGWIDKAYVYWYDEPQPEDYAGVVDGMARLAKYFPKLKRMLTEGFKQPLLGSVQLWCPITPKFAADPAITAERQKVGEEVWWYVCTGPKAPFCTLFIDHPGTELRMWLWQTWKYHVQGILIWETTWWSSSSQFKNSAQNCWQDPMSYNDQSSGVWGNGDGRMFYPPRTPARQASVEKPIDSIRWEMLAQGVQDWDCFHLLSQLTGAAIKSGRRDAAVREAQNALQIPSSICLDMTHFSTNPDVMDAWRTKVDVAIERLKR